MLDSRSRKLQSPALCPETETGSAKSRTLATPGVLSVSVNRQLPIKFWAPLRAPQVCPGWGWQTGGTSTVHGCHFLLAAASSVHVSNSATGTCSRRGSLGLPCQFLQNLGALGQDFRGHSHTGKCGIYIYKYLASFHRLHEQRPRSENPELWLALWRESHRAWEGEWNNRKLPSCFFALSQ